MKLPHTLYVLIELVDANLVRALSQNSLTKTLIQNSISKLITECLLLVFVALLSYELLYWSGIYLELWEYHAKDIFKEVPVHCAHVYVRLNVVKKSDLAKVRKYYQFRRESPYNIFKWKALNEMGNEIFELSQFVKYHFEFSPEDFENNPDPELGSTVEHLRQKTLSTFLSSSIYEKFYREVKAIPTNDILVFNNRMEEVDITKNKVYLSKAHIETGNIIDSIILI